MASYGPHFGEESPLIGRCGSGTIFFSNCNLECIYCQNYVISQSGEGREFTKEELADVMLYLQRQGCHNINLVTPTHVIPQILEALLVAVEQGLDIPLVYNSGGYESEATLHLLEGIIDIYMPDMKYADAKIGLECSGVDNYPEINKAAVKEMHRQVGDLQVDGRGVATKGLLVRHLVLPSAMAGTAEVARFLAQEVAMSTYLNMMNQYRPCYRANRIPSLARQLSKQEFIQAIELGQCEDLKRMYVNNRLLHSEVSAHGR
ncbi:MAG: 4Fe-4S cluster-binding domain-containing protein [Chloroflexota bacterium]|nr:4Fe-4S cluster-binding domain-containing protein [Chloroflexota bacterium]